MNDPMFHFLPNCTNSRQLTCLVSQRYVLEHPENLSPQVTRLPNRCEKVYPMSKDLSKKPIAAAVSDPKEIEIQGKSNRGAFFRGETFGFSIHCGRLRESQLAPVH